MEKAHLYEALHLVNHGIDEAVRGVQRLKKCSKLFIETYHKPMPGLERPRAMINLQFMLEMRKLEENDESYFEEEFNVWLDEPLANDEVWMNVQLLQEVVELNQAFARVIEGLKRMENVSFLQPAMVREDRAEVVLARIDFNRLFFGDFYKDYERGGKWAADFQRACLAKRCDPEDDYIGVRQREEARKKKGLPLRVVFFPDWNMRDEQRCDETQTERRKKAAKKRKELLKPKPKRNQRPADFTSGAETTAPQGTEAQ
jgi:hypothetical protein